MHAGQEAEQLKMQLLDRFVAHWFLSVDHAAPAHAVEGSGERDAKQCRG
jgi:hypothetical protein